MDESKETEPEKTDESMADTSEPTEGSTKEVLNSSKESEGENLEAIKKFIEDHEKGLVEVKSDEVPSDTKANTTETSMENNSIGVPKEDLNVLPKKDLNMEDKKEECEQQKVQNETTVVACVMDMILNQSEAQIAQKRELKPPVKRKLSGGEKNSMALSVGSKVEAKDFGGYWYPAEIIEVDYDEMEVLVHYEEAMKKHDEWISVSSPRLRPEGSQPTMPPSPKVPPKAPTPEPSPVIKEEKIEEKPKVTFAVGERCLARWRDNRRFVATVSQDLGDQKYEIMFDDGVRWTCNVIRLSKFKESSKRDSLTVDTTGLPSSCSTPSPVYGPGPSNAGVVPAPLPVFNTHLFDPTRDYLGSKSERREMKRKLNIKEIFNIGQKKKKVETPVKSKEKPKVVKEKAKVVKKAVKAEVVKQEIKEEVKKEIPDAVASIIGMVSKDTEPEEIKEEVLTDVELKADEDIKEEPNTNSGNDDPPSIDADLEPKIEETPMTIVEDEIKPKNFEIKEEEPHEKVLDRIKEAINKLEDGLNQPEVKLERMDFKPLLKEENKSQDATETKPEVSEIKEKKKKSLSKIKKVKKVRLLQEKRVKQQVEKVKSELEEVKRQMEEMKRKIREESNKSVTEMPENFLLPGEWCCKWVNGQPVGKVSEMENDHKVDLNNKPVLPRRSVEVEDKRLPPGWTKHMVRRSFGNSAGKWDVVLMSPDNRRLHTKTDMKHYLEHNPDESLKPYENALMDFGIHLKLSRRMGWYTTTADGAPEAPTSTLPFGTLSSTSPLVKRKKLSLKRSKIKEGKKKKLKLKLKVPRNYQFEKYSQAAQGGTSTEMPPDQIPLDIPPVNLPLEDGFVYVGSLKVQIIENLLRCPAEGCFKNFRNNTLLKMHIKHYHREMRKMLGATPKVLDLAYARQKPTEMEMRRLKFEAQSKTIKVKLPKLPRRQPAESKRIIESTLEGKEATNEPIADAIPPPLKAEITRKIPRSQDSPKLRTALNKPVKRPKVLLPVRRPEPTEAPAELNKEEDVEIEDETTFKPLVEVPNMEALDFETAISTHTVTRPAGAFPSEKKKKTFATIAKKTISEDEEWYGMNSDVETRSSYPRSGTPDSKMDQKLISSESNEEQKDANYLYTETGERIKIVHMKREEIINCHCGFREEDGLMVQCELCLCWQHALCHNIQKESDVPEKYTCSICLNPRRGRRSQRFLHDQDRLYEGLLPGAKPCELLRRSHELSGNLLRIQDALHAMRVKYYVATKKDHPKLYLWAKDWEASEIVMTQEKLNSDYSDLSVMITSLGKENRPVRDDMQLASTPPSEHSEDRFSQKDNQIGSQALLSGLLSSPGGASLDLPITTTELERLAKTVQAEQEICAPQPEAAIENSACRERLLKHIQRCQAIIDARLDSIEAQVAELESQDPSFEDDETADYFPRTKQTIQMLMRDLDTMEELGVIT